MNNKFSLKDMKFIFYNVGDMGDSPHPGIIYIHIPTRIEENYQMDDYLFSHEDVIESLKKLEQKVNQHYEKEKEKGFKKAEDIGLSKEQTTFGENNLSYPSPKAIKLEREGLIKELMSYNQKYVVFSQPEESKCILQMGFTD